MTLAVVEGRLVANGGATLRPSGADRWRMGADEIVFRGADRFERWTQEGDAIPYARVEPSHLDAPTLATFEGRYVSDEAPAEFQVRREGERLKLIQVRRTVDLSASYGDVFTGAAGVVTFERDSRGVVTALTLNNGRVRAMRFERR